MRLVISVLLSGVLLGGCEVLGIPNPEKEHAAKEAEGKAVGAACRHAGRAIEDCYTLNPKALKSAVFIGWKEMNDYMRDNKIEVAEPKLTGKSPEGDKGEKGEKKTGRLPGSDGFPAPTPFIKPKDPEAGTAKPEADKKTSGTETPAKEEERADRRGKAVINSPAPVGR